MARSLKVHPKHRQHVKSTVQREGFPRQKDLAEELNLSLATVSNFLNGKPVDYLNFLEIAERLSLNWQDIADVDNNGSNGVQGIYTSPETGQEQPEKIIYVERPPVEGLVHQTLLQPGSLIRIKAPSLTGKTILIARELKQIKQQGYQTVYLNRVGDIFPAALRRSSRACNPNLGFGSKSASIPRPLAAGFLI